MISKNKIKYIRSLAMKKFRNEHQAFLAEGNKLVADMLSSFDCELLIAKPSWMATQGDIPAEDLIVATDEDIHKASFLKSPQDVIAVFKIPHHTIEKVDPTRQLILMLDGIQDPGNLGTIIRLADWFGIEDIICSLDTADTYAPKTVQATMGALSHVNVHHCDIQMYLSGISTMEVPVYGTFLNGENIYNQHLLNKGIIVMGNEGNGIRPETEKYITNRLYIPNYPPERESTESLNVAIATAIICAEFRKP